MICEAELYRNRYTMPDRAGEECERMKDENGKVRERQVGRECGSDSPGIQSHMVCTSYEWGRSITIVLAKDYFAVLCFR
jgi:hypothetical protein